MACEVCADIKKTRVATTKYHSDTIVTTTIVVISIMISCAAQKKLGWHFVLHATHIDLAMAAHQCCTYSPAR